MASQVSDKTTARQYLVAIQQAVWRSQPARTNGWDLHFSAPLDIGHGLTQQTILFYNQARHFPLAAFLYWTSEDNYEEDPDSPLLPDFGYHQFKLVRGVATGSKPGKVKKRKKNGDVETDDEGNPVMIDGQVAISDTECAERLRTLHSRLSDFLGALDDAVGFVDASFRPRDPTPYVGRSKPQRYNGVIHRLNQPLLFRIEGDKTVVPDYSGKLEKFSQDQAED